MVPPARGIIWDNRGRTPQPMDFDRPHLDTALLVHALRGYPDQELRSFAVHGAVTKADAGSLATALGP